MNTFKSTKMNTVPYLNSIVKFHLNISILPDNINYVEILDARLEKTE